MGLTWAFRCSGQPRRGLVAPAPDRRGTTLEDRIRHKRAPFRRRAVGDGVVAYFGLIHQTKASPQAMKASMEKGMAKSMAEQMRARYQNQHAQPGQPGSGGSVGLGHR